MTDQVIEPVVDQDPVVTEPIVTDPSPVTPDSLGWRAGLSDEFKNHDSVKEYKNVSDFTRNALQVEKEHGELKTKMEGAIFKLGKDATPEDVAAYRKSMGVPDEAAGYELPKTEGIDQSEELITWFRGEAHKVGLTQEQVSTLLPAWDGLMQNMATAQATARETAVTEANEALKTEWGEKYDENLEFTRRGFAHFVGEDAELTSYLDESGDGNKPLLIKLFHKMGRAMGDDWIPPGTSDGTKKPAPGQEMDYDMPDFS